LDHLLRVRMPVEKPLDGVAPPLQTHQPDHGLRGYFAHFGNFQVKAV